MKAHGVIDDDDEDGTWWVSIPYRGNESRCAGRWQFLPRWYQFLIEVMKDKPSLINPHQKLNLK